MAMAEALRLLSAPKEIIKDKNGDVIGVRTVMQ